MNNRRDNYLNTFNFSTKFTTDFTFTSLKKRKSQSEYKNKKVVLLFNPLNDNNLDDVIILTPNKKYSGFQKGYREIMDSINDWNIGTSAAERIREKPRESSPKTKWILKTLGPANKSHYDKYTQLTSRTYKTSNSTLPYSPSKDFYKNTSSFHQSFRSQAKSNIKLHCNKLMLKKAENLYSLFSNDCDFHELNNKNLFQSKPYSIRLANSASSSLNSSLVGVEKPSTLTRIKTISNVLFHSAKK